MKKLLKIQLLKNDKIFATCNYLYLEPFASASGRKLTFSKVSFIEKEVVDLTWVDKIQVKVWCASKHKYRKQYLSELSITIIDTAYTTDTEFWIYGLIHHDFSEEYRQGVIDVFKMWEKNINVNWKELPIGSYLKKDYIRACLFFSSLSTVLLDRTTYQVDLSFATEEEDFLYLFSNAFLGERGYIGHNLFTFDDCLLEIFNHNGYFSEKNIIFNNLNTLNKNSVLIYEDFKKVLLKYKFVITELS